MKMHWACIDPWEAHCVECGEPDCYRSCPKYRPSRTGRCDRFADGRFLEWGKLELFWHGGVAGPLTATCVAGANRMLEPLALLLGPRVYRIYRSLRWRVARALAWRKAQPTQWRVAVETEREENLRLVLRNRDLNVLGEWSLHAGGLDSGSIAEIVIDLPPIEEGALFSIYPEGATESGKVRFVRNEIGVGCDAASHRTGGIKCIAWDLDGVIWDGTLSEGEDVTLRPGVMEAIRALDEVGIVSSICSKNEAEVALAKLKELGIEEWFVFPQINWGPKSASIWNLAKEMNIGLDALAFVDDRPENRAEVKVNCPGVRVWDEKECLELSRVEVERLRSGSGEGGLGPQRRKLYREEMARRAAAQSFAGDRAAFAAASGLDFELLPVEGERIARCRELVQRTNQLNLTARRYDEATFAALLRENDCVAVRAGDRYGDYGVVGFIARRGAHLVECCFSCRSAGRGLERRVLAELAQGGRLTADVVETDRNAPIREIVREFL